MASKIIASITSYPARITNVGISAFLLLTKQTVPPDEIHIWLSLEEFPSANKDLPIELQQLSNHPKIFIHWLKDNTYVHKRHEIFKYANLDDCIFLIDDDVIYSPKLIETVMDAHNKWNDAIICYNQYSQHNYNGSRIIYGPPSPESSPAPNLNRWCGQSMIPVHMYPSIVLDDTHQSTRNLCSPISDECWLQPWLVWYDTPIYHLNFDWGKNINPKIKKENGLCKSTHEIESNGLERRDNWLHAVLMSYPFIYKKYNAIWGYK